MCAAIGPAPAAAGLRFEPAELPPGEAELRAEIRALLAQERARGTPFGQYRWLTFCPEFSRRLGASGFVGMTWPKQYGGAGRSALERYVVVEELVAAGAPVGAHWVADRQSGPLLLRFGTEKQRCRLLPPMAAGESYFCIGMSEPDSGSDLAAIRTRARRVDGGWAIDGTKLWTTGAHECHYMIALVRTSPAGQDRHAGMSQMIVDLSSPGVEVRPIRDQAGHHHFNEVVFAGCVVPDDMVVGEIGDGWTQVMSELAFERSGPERFLTNLQVLVELVRAAGPEPDRRTAAVLGRLAAHIITLRSMSMSIAGMLQRGLVPNVEAAVVKDLGTNFQKEMPEIVRLLAPTLGDGEVPERLQRALDEAVLFSPIGTIQGGTREILRGIVARGLGLR